MMLLAPRKARKKSSDDSLIPLINIVFLLLIFFMVAGSIQPSIPVAVRHPEISDIHDPIKPLTVQVILTRSQDIYWNDRLISLKQLNELMVDRTPGKVNLHVDKDVLAMDLDPVLNVIRRHKVTSINFVIQE